MLAPYEIRSGMRSARTAIRLCRLAHLEPPTWALLAIEGGRALLKYHRRRHHRRHHRETVRLGLSFTVVEKGRSRIMANAITIGATQDVSCKLAPVDGAGNPTKPTGIQWSSSDPTVIQLQVAPDTLSALGVNLKAGTAQITAHLPGDPSGQVAVSESGDVTVSAGPPPPPPAATTAALGLTLTAVDKAPPPVQ